MISPATFHAADELGEHWNEEHLQFSIVEAAELRSSAFARLAEEFGSPLLDSHQKWVSFLSSTMDSLRHLCIFDVDAQT